MADGTAIFSPNANSYRRLRREMFAPVEPNWGVNHRAVAIRIPMSDETNLRFEHRAAGADANPYLVTAAIAAGVHWGLKNKANPGKMIEQGEHIRLKTRVPVRWDNCAGITQSTNSHAARCFPSISVRSIAATSL
jgi:glutamine synthetase